jgi:peptide/nickel transport system substrate-binding protein
MTRKSLFFCVTMGLLIGAFPDFGRAAQAKEEVLTIACGQEPLSLDLSQYTSGNDRVVVENWSEWPLYRETGGKVVPGVASWKMTPDGKKIEFTLKKGVKFHSGDPLTTKDIQFGYERGKAKSSGVRTGTESVERIEIVDDYRFNVYFKSPDVFYIPLLGSIPVISKNYYDRVGEDVFTRQPVGTGPYKMVAYRPGEYVDIERFEDYWGKKPPVKKARIHFIGEDTTRISKLMAGEADLISAVPFTDVRELEKAPNFKVVKLATNHPTRSILFGVNNPKMPWADKRVRLAMALAIDCTSIIHTLNDVPIHLAALAPDELGYDPTVKPYPYDPKRAKALLAEAGYPNGFDVKFYYGIGGRVSMQQEIAEGVASYWEAVGIRTKLMGEETAASLARRRTAQKPDSEYVALYTASFAGGADPTQPLNFYFSATSPNPVYTTPEISKVIAEGRSTMDDKKRAVLIKKAIKMITDDVGIIPVINAVSVYAMKKNVVFTPTKGVNFDFLFVKDMAFK